MRRCNTVICLGLAVCVGTVWLVSPTGLQAEITGPHGSGPGVEESYLEFTIASPSEGLAEPILPADIEVVWGRHQQVVEAVVPLLRTAGGIPSANLWNVIVYFDAPLATAGGFRRSCELMSRKVGHLARLGPVTVVVADPQPLVYASATSDPESLQQIFEDLREETIGFGELVWLRQRYVAGGRDFGTEIEAAEALRSESELLKRQRLELLEWLRSRSSGPANVLIMIQDGFDLNPRGFYFPASPESLREDPSLQPTQLDVARTLASERWVVVPVALEPNRKVFDDPFAPLVELAKTTGGEIVRSRKQLEPVLDRLAARFLVTLDISTTAPQQEGEIEVREVATGRKLLAPTWIGPKLATTRGDRTESVEAAHTEETSSYPAQTKVIELLRPIGAELSGPTRFQVIPSHRRVERVDFLKNGEFVDSDHRQPFESVIDLGGEIQPWTIEAVAFDSEDHELGDDRVEINSRQAPPEVSIVSLSDDSTHRLLEVRAQVDSERLAPTRVDFFFNQVLTHSFTQPPFVARIDYDELEPSDFVRVVAHYDDGTSAESAQMATSRHPTEVLEVNTIEILATVTSDQESDLPPLSQTDFVVHSLEGPVPIDHFAHSDHLPLAMGLLLDTSDSMDKVIESVGKAARQFFEQALGPQDEAFVVDFDTRPKLTLSATGDTDDLMRSIRGLRARGNTALYDSIAFSLQQFGPKAQRKALVVVTDGLDSTSRLLPRRCIELARQNGVPVYLIVIGSRPTSRDRRQVLFTETIARHTGGRTFYVTNLENLDQIYTQISSELRSQYLFAVTTDRALSPKELQAIEIEPLRKDLNVRAVLASQNHDS